MLTGEHYLTGYYETCRLARTAISAHLPRLRAYADGLELAQEFGVKRAASSAALLMGAHRVRSYDVVETREARQLAQAVDRWEYRIGDSRTCEIVDCDLLFVDSLHTYAQVRDELARHADRVRRFLIFHDVITFGSIGAVGETGRQAWAYTPGAAVPMGALGIRPAIDELMIRDPSWRIVESRPESHGLLVLERGRA